MHNFKANSLFLAHAGGLFYFGLYGQINSYEIFLNLGSISHYVSLFCMCYEATNVSPIFLCVNPMSDGGRGVDCVCSFENKLQECQF